MVKHAEGEGVGRRGSDIFLWGDKGANFVFRVMGVITSDRKHFSNTDPFVYCAYAGMSVWGWGGGKNWTSCFRVILGFLVVSLQFEPVDARVLVEHPVPRCPSCTPMLFGVHVNSPPPPPPDKYFIIIPCETNIFSCHGDILLLEYFHQSDVRTEFLH